MIATEYRRRREAVTERLRNATEPVSAAGLAEAAQIPGQHETKRRRIREIVEDLRVSGERICAGYDPATKEDGYWMARSDKEWHLYQECRRRNNRFLFARVAQMHRAANERQSGQQTLFETRRDRTAAWMAAQ
jgi:hypothetical protein